MKILVLGVDGYIGWTLALRLLSRDHEVIGVDNFITRKRVREVASSSALPILSFEKRNKALLDRIGKNIGFYKGDVSNSEFLDGVVEKEAPDAIVHLAEQRSAPYSMIGLKQAKETMVKNIVSTLNLIYSMKEHTPQAHLLKLGTMGEYGTPNIDIPEGFFEVEYNGRKDFLPFPKNAGSWYHWTKVHDSNNLMFANKVWGTRITDVMQVVVYGTRTKEIEETSLYTRFDIDEVWGTALNRFCAQAVANLPITPYGKGGQTRGFLSLEDSVACLTLALENPPDKGEYRVFNQFDEHYSVIQLAEMVKEVYEEEFGKPAVIQHVPNPRVEKEEHYYNAKHQQLLDLGLVPHLLSTELVERMFATIERHRDRIATAHILPKATWRPRPMATV